MSYASLLAGLTLIIIGAMLWKFKLVELLAGYKADSNVNKDLLSKASGLSLLLLGFLLVAESILIFKGVISGEKAIVTVVITTVLGVMVSALVSSHYSKA